MIITEPWRFWSYQQRPESDMTNAVMGGVAGLVNIMSWVGPCVGRELNAKLRTAYNGGRIVFENEKYQKCCC
jgi:hypothetical protein